MEPAPTAGALEGRLELADGGAVDRFAWTVRLQGPGRRWPMDAVRLGEDGRFRAEDLTPGRYAAVCERDHMPIGRVEELLVVCARPR